MKRVISLMVFLLLLVQGTIVANSRITKMSQSKIDHQWIYMPDEVVVDKSGLSNKQYPLKLYPQPTYIQSELLDVEGRDLGLTIRYYVATKKTHPIRIELVDENEAVIYFYENEDSQLNEQTMTMGGETQIGILEGVKKVRIRARLSNSYSEEEAIYIDELELYSKNGSFVETIELPTLNISVVPHQLVINSEEPTNVNIYSTSGVLIKKNAICKGANRIELLSGFYLIKLDNIVHKIVIP